MRLRLLTYNIHKGFDLFNRRYVLSEMRSAIRDVGADLVFFQEVLGYHPTDAANGMADLKENQFEYLADSIWNHFSYGRNAVYSAGHHGNAILSQYPVTLAENIDISTNPLESRGLLHAVVQLPAGVDLHLFNVHLDLTKKGRLAQMGRILERASSFVPVNTPCVVAGDFNDWQAILTEQLTAGLGLREAHQWLHGQHARTFPRWAPVLPLDRVYVRGFDVIDAQVLDELPWTKLSDHLPVLVTVELSGARVQR